MRETVMIIFKEFGPFLLLDAAFIAVTVLLVKTEGLTAKGKVWRFFRRLMYILLIGEIAAFLPRALSALLPAWSMRMLLTPSLFILIFPFPPLFGGLVQPVPIISEIIAAGVYASGFKKMAVREKIGVPLLLVIYEAVRYAAFWELASAIAR